MLNKVVVGDIVNGGEGAGVGIDSCDEGGGGSGGSIGVGVHFNNLCC